jgi:ankyrin repeat protein
LKKQAKAALRDPVAEIVAAVKANDASRVAALLQRHPELKPRLNDPYPGAPFGETPLLACLRFGNRELIDVLLAAGADINQKSHWWAGGFGVLDHAAEPGRPAWLAPFLIERGAIVDAHAATRLGMLERLDALLAADPAQLHARGGDGQTPLHVAPTVEIAAYLLDHGADIDARDVDHEATPAQWMVRDRQEVARYLVSRGAATDILLAAALGDRALVERHLEANPAAIRTGVNDTWFPKRDPRAGGHIYIWTLGHDRTPHTVAREFGHDEVFRLLMERSPAELRLAVAAELGDEPALRALLAAHPGLARTLGEADRRRLADAAHNNNTHAVRLMLAAGWPVDVRGSEGGTPLHWAAFHGNAEMVREILRHRPPLDTRGDAYDAPPIGWAIYGSVHGWHPDQGDYARTVELLLEAGAQPTPLTDDLQASEPVMAVLQRHAARRA